MRSFFQSLFSNWGGLTYRYRWLLIVASVGFAFGLSSQMAHLTIDTSTEGLLQKDDPTLLNYNAFQKEFGSDGRLLIAIDPPAVFDLAFLQTLEQLHEDLETEVPKVQEVKSLINARSTHGEGDVLVVEDLLEEFPTTEAELQALRQRVLGNPLYRNTLISPDGRVTAIVIETDTYSSLGLDGLDPLDEGFGGQSSEGRTKGFIEDSDPPLITGEEKTAIIDGVLSILSRYEGPEFKTYLTGTPVVTQKLQEYIGRDMRLFMGLAIGVVLAFLFALFRRVAAMILPLFVILLSLTSTLGLMGAFRVPVTSATQIIPSFLTAVGTGYAVHLLVIFFQRFDATGDKEESLTYALSHSGLPILMTALTTMVGMLSFSTASIRPIAMFGVFVPIGVLMSFIYSVVLLPALLAVWPMRAKKVKPSEGTENLFDHFLTLCGRISSQHPWKVVSVAAVLVMLSMVGIVQIRFSHNSLAWFPETDPIRISSNFIDEQLGGSIPMEILIDSGEENGLYDPELMQDIEAIEARLADYNREGLSQIGSTTSLLQILRETNQALNGNEAIHYDIPQKRNLIAQELLLFENSGSDDLSKVVDSQFQIARMTIKTRRRDSYEDIPFLARAEREFKEILGGRADVVITGLMPMMSRAIRASIETLTRSYIFAFLLITPLMMLFIGSLRAGLVSMVPNLTPILITLGFMGWVGLPLDIFTLLIGCIGIGLAVDDTIHLIHSFQGYYTDHGDAERAVRQALKTTGKALLFTSLVLCSSFFIYTASTMNALVNFGILTGGMIAIAFFCDVLVTPALLILISPKSES